jgi:hypothetical protein
MTGAETGQLLLRKGPIFQPPTAGSKVMARHE